MKKDRDLFSIGQRVWHRNGQRSGTVLECDGDRVFIAQDNGAELDFKASDLLATPPSGARTPGEKLRESRDAGRAGTATVQNRVLTARDVTPEHTRVLGVVPIRTLRAIATVYERRPGVAVFTSLGVAEKLNVITEITTVPYRIMREYSDRPGELGLLMGKGLADSSTRG